MNVLLACAVICIALWWIRHNQLYMDGQVKNPFFSLGSSASRPVAKRRGASRQGRNKPLLMATPVAMTNAVRQISTYTHNEEISARLLHSTRQANMSRPLEWCVEKTIEDLLRDRR